MISQTTVGINPWVLSRDKSFYGEDADVFRPERWFEFSPEHLKTIGKITVKVDMCKTDSW